MWAVYNSLNMKASFLNSWKITSINIILFEIHSQQIQKYFHLKSDDYHLTSILKQKQNIWQMIELFTMQSRPFNELEKEAF